MTTDQPAPAAAAISHTRFHLPVLAEERRDAIHNVPVVVVAPQEQIDAYAAADEEGKRDIFGPIPETGAGILFIPDEVISPSASATFANDLVETLMELAAQAVENRQEQGLDLLPLSIEEQALIHRHRIAPPAAEVLEAEAPTSTVVTPGSTTPRPGRVVTPGLD